MQGEGERTSVPFTDWYRCSQIKSLSLVIGRFASLDPILEIETSSRSYPAWTL